MIDASWSILMNYVHAVWRCISLGTGFAAKHHLELICTSPAPQWYMGWMLMSLGPVCIMYHDGEEGAMGNVSSAFLCLLNIRNEIREYSKTWVWVFVFHFLRLSICLVQRSGMKFTKLCRNILSHWFVSLSVTAIEYPHCPRSHLYLYV